MKDPLLQEYTFEELLYEYHSIGEHQKAKADRAEEEADKIEEDKAKAGEDWADQMEAEELAAEQAEVADPSKDANNIKWMEEQMAKEKEIHGEDFGEDLSLDFNSPEK